MYGGRTEMESVCKVHEAASLSPSLTLINMDENGSFDTLFICFVFFPFW
jgi:hypothetical protein